MFFSFCNAGLLTGEAEFWCGSLFMKLVLSQNATNSEHINLRVETLLTIVSKVTLLNHKEVRKKK